MAERVGAPSLVVFGGLPGVGKTTLSRGVAAHIGALHLRIDTIEQEIRRTGASLRGPEGYDIARAVAEDNLRLGLGVVIDAVNPIPLTRAMWTSLASRTGARCVTIEVVCSDPVAHRERVEGRRTDVPGLVLPTWAQVMARDYRPWDDVHHVVDTAGRDPQACVDELIARVAPQP